ncbi:MAG: hypothetical protein GAK35_00516 [Herbaspirillum frisingense]|uniref:Type 4a pilus biogenesis protein PilO n=1 Tax=Herbaspirillum frisingense TaxID=92645 RepID=A0A7V8FZV9_9BURK|nr:MAG: hypothetical protein GAK35_00516 [Herbaspirillum frisingense]
MSGTRRLSTHPAHWPLPARAGLWLATMLLCLASGLLLCVEELVAARQAAQHRRADLQMQFRSALKRAAELPALTRQQAELDMQLAKAEQPLWPDAGEDAALLHAKLARRAEECGLALESFKPQAAGAGHQAGATIGLSGSYAGLQRFAELVSAPPLPVLIDGIDIAVAERGGEEALLMTATIITARRWKDKKEQP